MVTKGTSTKGIVHRFFNRCLGAALACAGWGWLFAGGSAQAANVSWNNASGGAWETGANWLGGSAPTAVDFALFNLGGTYTTTINTSATVNGLGSTLAAAGKTTLQMNIIDSSNIVLTSTLGGVSQFFSGTSFTFARTGTGSGLASYVFDKARITVRTSGTFSIGAGVTVDLNVAGGAGTDGTFSVGSNNFNNASDTGHMVVSGSGAIFDFQNSLTGGLGSRGLRLTRGSITVDSGGYINGTGRNIDFSSAFQVGGTFDRQLTVTGSNSRVDASDLTLAGSAGTTLVNDRIYVEDGGQVTLSGQFARSGTMSNTTLDLQVSSTTANTSTFSAGGINIGVVGTGGTSTGKNDTATVSVGGLLISTGTTTHFSGTNYQGDGITAKAGIVVGGTTVTSDDAKLVLNGGTIQVTTGTGGPGTVGGLLATAESSFEANGTVDAINTRVAGDFTVGVGSGISAATGELTTSGNLRLYDTTNTTFVFNSISDFSNVLVGGDLVLEGDITFQFNFAPAGGSFVIFDAAGTVTGDSASFNSITWSGLATGGSLDVIGNDVVLTNVVPEPAAIVYLLGAAATLWIFRRRRRAA